MTTTPTASVAGDPVWWSAPADQRAGRPLLVLLHGHGMDEQMGAEVRDRLPPELVLASLRGPLRVRSGYGWFPLDAELRRRRLPVFSGRGDADRRVPAALVATTDRWLADHTTLTRRVYPGLGHGMSAAEIADLAGFLRAQLPRA